MAKRKKTTMPKPLTSITSIDGRAVIQYNPGFGKSQPFLTLMSGAACPAFSDLATAKRFFMNSGHPFTADDNWK